MRTTVPSLSLSRAFWMSFIILLSPVAAPHHSFSFFSLTGSSSSASKAAPAEVVSASDAFGPMAQEQSPLAQSPGSERLLLPASLTTAAEELP